MKATDQLQNSASACKCTIWQAFCSNNTRTSQQAALLYSPSSLALTDRPNSASHSLTRFSFHRQIRQNFPPHDHFSFGPPLVIISLKWCARDWLFLCISCVTVSSPSIKSRVPLIVSTWWVQWLSVFDSKPFEIVQIVCSDFWVRIDLLQCLMLLQIGCGSWKFNWISIGDL